MTRNARPRKWWLGCGCGGGDEDMEFSSLPSWGVMRRMCVWVCRQTKRTPFCASDGDVRYVL